MQTMTGVSEKSLNDAVSVEREPVIARTGVATTLSEPSVVAAVLRALASMAQISQRHEAEVDTASYRAGLLVGADTIADVLRQLGNQDYIGGLIPLSDGGLLLTVTTFGIGQAGIS